MYEYKAELVRTIDGDTAIMRCDLGFHAWYEVRVRLLRVYAPELKSTGGFAAKAELFDLLTRAGEYRLVSRGIDRYGRSLGEIYREFGGGISCVNDEMLIFLGGKAAGNGVV